MILLTFFLIFYTTLGQGFTSKVEPCELSNYKCIRSYLARNSDCSPGVWGSVPSSVTVLNRSYRIPYTNSTNFDQYAIVKNIQNCYVSAFFFNTDTNVAVLGISCPNIKAEAKRRTVVYKPNAESIVYSGKIFIEHSLLQFTVNLKHADEIDLCNAFVYTHLSTPPKIKMIPSNERTRRYLAGDGRRILQNHITTVFKEELLVAGYYIFHSFVNNILCDFGCTV